MSCNNHQLMQPHTSTLVNEGNLGSIPLPVDSTCINIIPIGSSTLIHPAQTQLVYVIVYVTMHINFIINNNSLVTIAIVIIFIICMFPFHALVILTHTPGVSVRSWGSVPTRGSRARVFCLWALHGSLFVERFFARSLVFSLVFHVFFHYSLIELFDC